MLVKVNVLVVFWIVGLVVVFYLVRYCFCGFDWLYVNNMKCLIILRENFWFYEIVLIWWKYF